MNRHPHDDEREGVPTPESRGTSSAVLWEEFHIQAEDLQRAHQRAKQALDRYRSLFEESPVGYLTLDHEGVVVEGSGTVTELLGELAGEPFRVFLHAADQELFAAHLAAVLRNREHTSCRVRFQRPGKPDQLLKLDSAPVPLGFPGHGRHTRTVLSLATVPELSAPQLEQASSLLDQTEGVMDLDGSGRVRWLSETARLLFRGESGELVGRDVADLFEGSGVRQLQREVQSRTNGVYETQLLALRADNSTFPAEVRVFSSTDLGRDGTLLVLRDRSIEHLLQVELFQAQRMEALGRFSASVLLEIQNLLSGVFAATEVSMKVLGNRNAARPPMKMIRTASRTALELTGMVLSLRRNKDGSMQPLELDGRIRELTPLLERLVGVEVSLEVRPGARNLYVQLEAGALAQMLLNLLTNACDAMPAGGEVSVRTRADPERLPDHLDRRLQWVVLEVEDTGEGIDGEAMPSIFEPFFSTKQTGTGLGLTTVRKLAQVAGGDVAATSSPEGTQFRVYLPCQQGSTADDGPVEDAEPEPRSEGARERSRLPVQTALVVDPSPLSLLSIEYALRQQGHRVLGVSSPKDAVWAAKCLGESLDVAFVDLAAEGGGKRLAQELRQLRTQLRVVYITGDLRESEGLSDPVVVRPVDAGAVDASLHMTEAEPWT